MEEGTFMHTSRRGLYFGLLLALVIPAALFAGANLGPAATLAAQVEVAAMATSGDGAVRIYLPMVLEQSQGPVPTPTSMPPPGSIWQPPLVTSWQWQLAGTLDQSFAVDMYDIDMFETGASAVAALHAQGRKAICYISAGTWENWRPDANQFPKSVIGKPDPGWSGEYWLDIRRIDILGPIMKARMDQCKQKGFDGLEPDNVDGYQNNTGFAITYQDQINYNTFIANEAHARGLSVGLKNDLEQVDDLRPAFDWLLVEDCYAQGECNKLTPFVSAGKAVFDAEYTDTGVTMAQFCPVLNALNVNAIFKHRNLDAWRQACR